MSLPEQIAYGQVTGRFILTAADGDDPDSEPDAVPVKGTVTFIPSRATIHTPAALVLQGTYTYTLDTEGNLVDSSGNTVMLVAAPDEDPWTYRVIFNFSNAASPNPMTFRLAEDETVDLRMLIPVDTSTGNPAWRELDDVLVSKMGDPDSAAGQVLRSVVTSVTQERLSELADSGEISGLSAYEDAVRLGFDGTIEEWLESITGPEGDQGDQGPPNTLTAGTITQIPAGGQPTFSITGTSPDQTLNLGLVDGSPTAFELRGEGFPGTGSNATATNAAATGTYYTDVLGTNGAWRWLKTSAGTGNTRWAVMHGDTGARNVTGEYLKSGWEPYHASIHPQISRVGNTVFLTGMLKRTADVDYSTAIFDLPEGFRPRYSYGSIPLLNITAGANTSNGLIVEHGTSLSVRYGPGVAAALAPNWTGRIPVTSWYTNNPWPSTLPFAPA